jgi:ribosomal protein S21
MSITVAVQNNKAMQAYAKLKKQLQQDNIIRIYRNKRYFMTAQQKVQTKISMRVMRAKALKMAQAKNVSSAF